MGVDGTPSEGEGREKKRDRSGEPNLRRKGIKKRNESKIEEIEPSFSERSKRARKKARKRDREREREREKRVRAPCRGAALLPSCSGILAAFESLAGDAPPRERSPEAPRRLGESHKVRRLRSDAAERGGGEERTVYCD